MSGKGKKRKSSQRGKKKGRKKRRQPETRGRRFIDFAVVAMLGLAVYFAIIGGEYTVFELRKLEKLQRESAAELAHTEAELDSLSRIAAELRNDPAAIERVARERYGMIRDGEILYRFREVAPAPDSTIDEPEKAE